VENELISKTHLFRGAPSVRAWSKYQETDKLWTLCGIRTPLDVALKGDLEGYNASEDLEDVSCSFCLQLSNSPVRRCSNG
jgi:hypothetical protein